MAPELQVSERELCELPEDFVVDAVTADGHAYGVMERDGRLHFVWDGVVGDPFDGLSGRRDGTVKTISDDGNHVAYVGVRSERSFVGRDGREEQTVDGASGSVPPVLSVDGQRFAYGALVDGSHHLIVDGSAMYGALAPIAAVFSDDGSRLAYVESSEPNDRTAEHRVVIDGVPGPWFRGMRNARGAMQFSPDGRRFAYYQIDGKGHGRWVVDDIAHPWFNDSRPIGLAQMRGVGVLDPGLPALFSPDGERFAYTADVEGKGMAVVEDGEEGPRVKGATWPVFSSDGRHLAYGVQTFSGRGAVVIDGRMGGEWPQTPMTPVLSDDGGRVAVTALREEGSFFRKQKLVSLIVDDEVVVEQVGVDAAGKPAFSPDGAHVAWWASPKPDRMQIYLDGSAIRGPFAISEPVFSSTGHLAFAEIDQGATVFMDGRPGPRALDFLVPIADLPREMPEGPAPFRLSRDGEHVAWAGMFEPVPDGAARPVLDDRVGPAFDGIFNWSFDTDGVATWWAQRGRSLVRVTAA